MEKFKNLEKRVIKLSSFALAFSGGVDSTLLLAVAKRLIPQQIVAMTLSTQFVPQSEIESAKKIADSIGVEHISIDENILEDENIVSNTMDRCYFCKKKMFSIIRDTAEKYGINNLVHGVNLDDLKEFRPGLKAAEELGFISPFVQAGIAKKDIREISKQMGLDTWDKPSNSCLATRIAYNEKISFKKLVVVEKAETFLRDLGFNYIRVRCSGKTARIEVDPGQIVQFMDETVRQKISKQFVKFGFKNTSIDMDGYQMT